MNENGQTLLELCCHHGLSILTHYSKTNHVTKCPGDILGRVIGINSIRRDALNNVLNTRSYHGADCDTDHTLICARVRMQHKRLFHSKQNGHIRINIINTTYPEKNQQFNESIRTALYEIETESAEANWNTLRDIIYDTALTTYGNKQRKNTDWYEANITLMEHVIDAKRSALINFKRDPSQRNKTIGYNSARASRHRVTQEISGACTMELRRQQVQL